MRLSRLILAGVGVVGMVGAGFAAPAATAATHPTVKPAPVHTVHAASFNSCTDNSTINNLNASGAYIGVNGSEDYQVQDTPTNQKWDVCYSLNGDGYYYFISDHDSLYLTDYGDEAPVIQGNATGSGPHEAVIVTCEGKNEMYMQFATPLSDFAYNASENWFQATSSGSAYVDISGRCTI